MKTKLFTLFVALIATTALFAFDCEIDGIYYNLNTTDLTAEVTFESYGSLSYSGSIVIPSTITYNSQTYSVTTIGEYAFSSCLGLTSVTIPNSVTTIGERAFFDCRSLASIEIPSSVKSIGRSAFIRCDALTSINVDAANTHYCSIDGVLFNYAKDTLIQYPSNNAKTAYTIPNSVTSIGESAFFWSGLTSVSIPNSVTTIGGSAFNNCTRLTSIAIPNSVTTIGEYAFSSCHGLTSVTIPNSVTIIGKEAFSYTGLTSVTIPYSIGNIGNFAFLNSPVKTVYLQVHPFIGNEVPSKITKAFFSNPTFINVCDDIIVDLCAPTSVRVNILLGQIDISKYDKLALDFAGTKYEINTNNSSVIVIGMNPSSTHKATFYSQSEGLPQWNEGFTLEITTPELVLTTQTPKVVAAGTAIVAAETNISDYETNVGFEWRKYDAPESMPSKSGTAIICNGVMEGRLLNLGTDAYWNVRPYYEAADGTRYYGEWITFDPSDFSYFEPTVHTYALTTSPTSNNVQVRGYVMTGTDEVTEQGFEYWANGAAAPQRVAATTSNDVQRVTATGQLMTAVLENLAYNTTYTCRAYALANGKTYYGEEIQFLTPENTTGLFDVFMNNSNAQKVTKYLHNGQLIIDRNGQHYSVTGQKLR